MGCYWAPSLSDELVQLQIRKLDSLPAEKPCLMIGDINGRLGERLNDSRSNSRGRLIAHNLDSRGWNLMSEQVTEGRWTFLQGNRMSVVDWMAGNSFLQFKPFSLCIYDDAEFAGSDHKLVSCSVQVTLPDADPNHVYIPLRRRRWHVERLEDSVIKKWYDDTLTYMLEGVGYIPPEEWAVRSLETAQATANWLNSWVVATIQEAATLVLGES